MTKAKKRKTKEFKAKCSELLVRTICASMNAMALPKASDLVTVTPLSKEALLQRTNDELREQLRYLFYYRLALGTKMEDSLLSRGEDERCKRIYELLEGH